MLFSPELQLGAVVGRVTLATMAFRGHGGVGRKSHTAITPKGHCGKSDTTDHRPELKLRAEQHKPAESGLLTP